MPKRNVNKHTDGKRIITSSCCCCCCGGYHCCHRCCCCLCSIDFSSKSTFPLCLLFYHFQDFSIFIYIFMYKILCRPSFPFIWNHFNKFFGIVAKCLIGYFRAALITSFCRHNPSEWHCTLRFKTFPNGVVLPYMYECMSAGLPVSKAFVLTQSSISIFVENKRTTELSEFKLKYIHILMHTRRHTEYSVEKYECASNRYARMRKPMQSNNNDQNDDDYDDIDIDDNDDDSQAQTY